MFKLSTKTFFTYIQLEILTEVGGLRLKRSFVKDIKVWRAFIIPILKKRTVLFF